MVYVTGDTHIPIDVSKLNTANFPQQRCLTRDDYVIVLGDFGLLWRKDKTYEHWLKWLESKPFTVLWIDGNHENHEWLRSIPTTKWRGGRIRRIGKNIIHLDRGSIFDFGGKYFFVMGGAASVDRESRIEGISWWPQEVPSYAESEKALRSIERHHADGLRIDYVLTHTCPTEVIRPMFDVRPMDDPTTKLLSSVNALVADEMAGWYFGHWHVDTDCGKYHCLYQTVLQIC